mgnify:CR=1 FL=1|jgi:5-formyltetrahydrofolate cyclo-ligase|tara:strand:+ start:1409 stop:1987 length:579 start_codon:yes stop_codon:yes gene_type:complete
MESKKELRKRLVNLRKKVSKSYQKRQELNIFKKIIKEPCYNKSNLVAIYLAKNDELSIEKILYDAISKGKKVFIPKIYKTNQMVFISLNKKTKLTTNKFGIMEPTNGDIIDPKWLDLVIVPLLGFDKTGARLGMGGGYYDKYFHFMRLRKKWFRPKLVGIGLEKQGDFFIKKDPWDIDLWKIITEKKVYNFK